MPFVRVINGVPALEFADLKTLGLDVVGSVSDIGTWVETAYHDTEDPQKRGYEVVFGADYTFPSGVYTVVEYYFNRLTALEKTSGAFMAATNYKVKDFDLRVNLISGTGEEAGSWLVNPATVISLRPALTLTLGVQYGRIPVSSRFHQLGLGNAFYARFESSF